MSTPSGNKITVFDKSGNTISIGDRVSAEIRGGRAEGVVQKIVINDSEAQLLGVIRPPKVLFRDQWGCDVQHSPGNLVRVVRGGGV